VEAPAPAGVYQPEIIARPSEYFRLTRYIFVLLLVAGGVWFAYDGWHGYPMENVKKKQALAQGDDAQARRYTLHSDMDIGFQKGLGIGLPILGAFMLVWSLRQSRGVYRLTGQTLLVPGHPPVPLNKIIALDRAAWDRKGIAYVEYDVNGINGRLKLDDFIYQRDPTDEIFKRIEASLHRAG
jgi:hypothetical protein